MVLFSACQKNIYFTEDLRKVVEINNLDMKKIQFYNSANVTLRRDVTSEEAKVSKGKITISNGKIIEEIYLRRETKGICKSFNAKSVNVAFESADQNGFNFSRSGDFYVITTKSQKTELIDYDEKEYLLIDGVGCKLMVKKSQFKNLQKSVRRLKGLKVE